MPAIHDHPAAHDPVAELIKPFRMGAECRRDLEVVRNAVECDLQWKFHRYAITFCFEANPPIPGHKQLAVDANPTVPAPWEPIGPQESINPHLYHC